MNYGVSLSSGSDFTTMGTFGVLAMVPMVILPLVSLTAIGIIGSLKTPNGYWPPLATLLLVVTTKIGHRL